MLSTRFGLGYWGVFLLVFIIPWENVVTLPEIGTATRLAGLAALALGLLHIVIFGRRIRVPLPLFATFVFILLAGLSVLWSVDSERTVARTMTYLQLGVFAFLVVNFATTWEQVRLLLLAYIAGSIISALYTIDAYATGQVYVYQRYAAEGFDTNDLALTIGLGMAFGLAFLFEGRLLTRAMVIAAMALIAYAMLLTASRAGFLGLGSVLAMLLLPLVSRNSQRPLLTRVVMLTTCAAALFYAFTFVPEESWNRVTTTPDELVSGTANNRYPIWLAYGELIAQAPLLGYGAGASRSALWDPSGLGAAHHNVFLAVASDLGLVGGGLFILILAATMLQIRKLPDPERMMWAAAFLVLFAAIMSLSWEVRKPLWLVLSLVIARAAGQAEAAARPGHRGLRGLPPWSMAPPANAGVGATRLRAAGAAGSSAGAARHPDAGGVRG